MDINDNTPIVMLTVGQLKEVLGLKDSNPFHKKTIIKKEKHYVYGLDGIKKLFNVSHLTAWKYKETIIREAVSQNGRVIVTDVEKAMELFAKHNKEEKK